MSNTIAQDYRCNDCGWEGHDPDVGTLDQFEDYDNICPECGKDDVVEVNSPMHGEESWHAPQDPGHRRSAKWGFGK